MKHNQIFEMLKCKNDLERLAWIENKLGELVIPYEKSSFTNNASRGKKEFNNLYLPGSSDKMIIAHYDTVRPEFSANDNTASVINAIILKLKFPEINLAILDGEEPPYFGIGSDQLCDHLRQGKHFTLISEILNLELTGVGRNVCVGNKQRGSLKSKLKNINFLNVPFSDSDILDKNNFINNVVMFLLPDNSEKLLDASYIYYCHTPKDNPSIIKIEDMEWFTDVYLNSFINTWLNE